MAKKNGKRAAEAEQTPVQVARERIKGEWWDAWWEADYSWEGLAATDEFGRPRHPWEGWMVIEAERRVVEFEDVEWKPGVRRATLQDYWRRLPGTDRLRSDQEMGVQGREGAPQELIQVAGQPTFHVVHLPLRYRDRTTVSPKSFPDAWFNVGTVAYDLIAARLNAARDSGADFYDDVERRACLDGAVMEWVAYRPKEKAAANEEAGQREQPRTGSDLAERRPITARFRNCCFYGDAYFRGIMSNCSFERALFEGNCSFFSGANFKKKLDFTAAKFLGETHFPNCTFADVAFEESKFAGDITFSGNKFEGAANFNRAEFIAEASFFHCDFRDDAMFRATQFKRPPNFSEITCRRFADFYDATLCTDAEGASRVKMGGALFLGPVDWRSTGYGALAALSGARLEHGALIDEFETEGKELQAQRQVLDSARGDRSALRAIEGGALVLKRAMEQRGDKAREQRFYRLEIMARRMRGDGSWVANLTTDLYATFANHGTSIASPFLWLLALVPLSAAGYWAWEAALSGVLGAQIGAIAAAPADADPWRDFWRALSFSTGRMLPFGPWAEAQPWLAAMDSHGAGWGFGARLAATAQSLLAAILAFLFGLAIRRRFQIT